MNYAKINKELFDFLDNSPNAFFAVDNIKTLLLKEGFVELSEGDNWKVSKGGKYFVTRNDSAIIAFKVPESASFNGFQIMASHSDSPSFKIKPNAEIYIEDHYAKLNTEGYGGMIMSTWFDRPLSVAGRILVKTEQGIKSMLVNIDRDLLMIPNLAIHFNREINSGYKYNAQKDLLPLFADLSFIADTESSDGDCSKPKLLELVANECGITAQNIIDADLYLYNRAKAVTYGNNNEFIASGRLDDLQCAFASVKGLILSEPSESISVCYVSDNEEVGSGTKQGADGTFLYDVLTRINSCLGNNMEDFHRAVSNSFMVSADNAHAVHPNYQDKTDQSNRPYLNGGIVIKYNSNQLYTTDAVSGALFMDLCNGGDIPVQKFVNRSDIRGGSTLGNISQSHISMNTLDIGLPQLAMHSAYETAGSKDTAYLAAAAKKFFSVSFRNENGCMKLD